LPPKPQHAADEERQADEEEREVHVPAVRDPADDRGADGVAQGVDDEDVERERGGADVGRGDVGEDRVARAGVEEQAEDGEEDEIDAYNVGMSSNISPAELALLEYLHARSGTSGGRIGLDPKPITRDLRISMTRLAETSASLAALGLAGVRHNRPSAEGVASTICAAIWVTSKGQDYLKRARSAAVAEKAGRMSARASDGT
jgi:hypothetical protein